MSYREAAILLTVMFVSIATAAAIFTWINRTKPSPFVSPAIWSEPYTGGAPRQLFDI